MNIHNHECYDSGWKLPSLSSSGRCLLLQEIRKMKKLGSGGKLPWHPSHWFPAPNMSYVRDGLHRCPGDDVNVSGPPGSCWWPTVLFLTPMLGLFQPACVGDTQGGMQCSSPYQFAVAWLHWNCQISQSGPLRALQILCSPGASVGDLPAESSHIPLRCWWQSSMHRAPPIAALDRHLRPLGYGPSPLSWRFLYSAGCISCYWLSWLSVQWYFSQGPCLESASSAEQAQIKMLLPTP